MLAYITIFQEKIFSERYQFSRSCFSHFRSNYLRRRGLGVWFADVSVTLIAIIFLKVLSGPKKGRFNAAELDCLLAAGVFGDGLGAFADGVLGQFTGQEETHSSLDLSACDG